MRMAAVLAVLALGIASPASAAGFVEEVISFETHDGLTIEGILSYPNRGDGPYPGMLMISGSGLNDADVTIFDRSIFNLTDGRQKIFRNMARTFSKKGYTVLRYNKRGATFGHFRENPAILDGSTIQDVIEDARNARRFLMSHPKTAASPQLILGWSEGSYVATRLARDAGDVDLLILMGAVGRSFEKTLRYQAADRYIDFFAQAVDGDGDGVLTLEEFGALDDRSGLRSFWVLSTVDLLFGLGPIIRESTRVEGFNPETDVNGDGRLDLETELEPAIRASADALIANARAGGDGIYMQSYFSLKPNLTQIRKTGARILFVVGDADTQTPVPETLALIERLEKRPKKPWDLILFEGLGHTLAPPRDYILTDGGLTVFDNLTLNAPSKTTIRAMIRGVKRAIKEIRR